MNHAIVTGKSEQITMSSREIADLVESRHDDVKRSIERLANRGVIQLPPMAEVRNHLGQTVSVYSVGKRDSYVIVAQLSPEFTARLVDRWQELEQQVAQPSFQIPASLSEALRLAADQAEQIEQQQALIEQQKPAVQFVDKYVETTGLKGFRQVAKLLKANERELRDFLISHKIMYRIGGEWTAYQNHIDAGRFQSKTGTNENNGHAYTRAMFTPKGVNWLAGLWAQYQIGKQDEVAA
jgi:phage antirepressor YoqD-like protein